MESTKEIVTPEEITSEKIVSQPASRRLKFKSRRKKYPIRQFSFIDFAPGKVGLSFRMFPRGSIILAAI